MSHWINDLTLTMHIGSSSRMPSTSPDAPIIVSSSMHFVVTVGSVLDYIFSGVMDRYPNLKLFFAESQAGWLPYVLEQADWLWGKREGASLGSPLPKPPSTYFHDRMWTSVFSDGVALANRDAIGIDQICFETDYPHSVTTFPHTKREAEKLCANAGLSERETYKLLRGNAIAAFGLDRVGISA